MFNVVPGLDGKPGSVSLELGSKPGCFLVAGASAKVQVGCRSRGSDGPKTLIYGEREGGGRERGASGMAKLDSGYALRMLEAKRAGGGSGTGGLAGRFALDTSTI
uniref:Uncharacterized protein n=1 Tax=Oryza nivara TaxID=4536 RepID=A0A0E0G286_ORYNI